MRIGFVGCGFTADCYMPSLKRYPHLELVAATDKDPERAAKFCKFHSVPHYPDLQAMLADPKVEMVVNLTNSSRHYEVSKACLEAGKHLFSEKPLAMTLPQAQELVDLANTKGLYYSSAPCGLLGETAQTLWRALRSNAIGEAHVAYAELEDGPFHLAEPQTWRTESGAPYDYREEFSSGVTLEHAGYYLTLFAAFFGPAKSITSFSSCLWPDRPISPEERLSITTPDFTVACVTFESGVVARLTSSLIGPYNHVMRIVGDTGILRIHECWNFTAPVYFDQYSSMRFRADRYPISKIFPLIPQWLSPGPRIYPPVKKVSLRKRLARYRMDYARGISDLARAAEQQRLPRIPSDLCLHVTELALAIQNATETPYKVKTTFKPLQPMTDAELSEYLAIKW